MRNRTHKHRMDIPDWSGQAAGLPAIVCSEPLAAFVADLERRYTERVEERPEQDPAASIRWVLDQLTYALDRARKLDRWLTLEQVAELADCSAETVRRKTHGLEDGLWRRNGLNGRLEVHVEGVAALLDMTTDEIEALREKAA